MRLVPRFARHGIAAAIAAAVLALPALGAEEPPAKQPYELVRSLRTVQDQVARGSLTAHAFQKKFIPQISAQLSKEAPEVWQDPRNARAAVIFVLSGGNPSVLRQLLEHGVNPAVDTGLLKGALAYSEGRVAEADRLLSKFDARTLDPSLAGLIALVQAMLAEKKNNIRLASSLFDDAKLLAPGTLVEESALRRQAFMLAADNKLENFEVISSQYFRRFGHCVYGIIFRREFGRTLAASKYVDDLNLLRRLEPVLNALNPDERQELYMVATAEGIRRGKVAFTRYTAAQAASLTPPGTAESWRVQLYENAAAIVTDDYEKGLAGLQGIQRTQLARKDAAMLDAALFVAREVRRLPALTQAGAPPPPPATPAEAALSERNGVDIGEKAAGRSKDVLAAAVSLLNSKPGFPAAR